MRFQKLGLGILSVLLLMLSGTVAAAGDFDWTKDFNMRAEADPSGFRAGLATRFKVGDAEINAVIGDVERPSDAYMVFRLGEMSSHPPGYVMERYRKGKGKGWGELAKSLGIKPGSREFHALKRDDDLYDRHGKVRHMKKKPGARDRDKDRERDRFKDRKRDKARKDGKQREN